MPKFHYQGLPGDERREDMRVISSSFRRCREHWCQRGARNGSKFCIQHDPTVSEEEKDAALAKENPAFARSLAKKKGQYHR